MSEPPNQFYSIVLVILSSVSPGFLCSFTGLALFALLTFCFNPLSSFLFIPLHDNTGIAAFLSLSRRRIHSRLVPPISRTYPVSLLTRCQYSIGSSHFGASAITSGRALNSPSLHLSATRFLRMRFSLPNA